MISEDAKNKEYRDGKPAAWASGERLTVSTSSYSGEIQAIFYGFDTARFYRSLFQNYILEMRQFIFLRTYETIIQTKCDR